MPPAIWLIDAGASRDPRFNLALEEHCLGRMPPRDTAFVCYVNTPAVIVGRNQNVFAEVDRAYVLRQRLPVIRRVSGGGAVYHDGGNLNFAFLSPGSPADVGRWSRWTDPIRAALAELGVTACLTPRHGLETEGLKFSGTAQYARAGRLLSHGTLLYASDLAALERALRRPPDLLEARGRPSVASPVTNLAHHIAPPMPLEAFRRHLVAHVARALGGLRRWRPGEGDWRAIRRLAEEKYGSWEWNVGRSPACRIRREVVWGAARGTWEITVEQGRVQAVDRAAAGPAGRRLARAAGAVQGRRFHPDDLAGALASLAGAQAPGLALCIYGG